MTEKILLSAGVLIIGGGTAGLFAAIRLSALNPQIKILVVEISAALVTSLIGYYRAVSTLTVAFAKKKILPAMFISRRNALIFAFYHVDSSFVFRANGRRLVDGRDDDCQTQMEEKNVAFSVDASGVSNRYVMCDRNRWNRVLLNLVGNAYKFTPSGKSVSVSLSERENGQFELRVKDTGIGMSQDFAKKIFQALIDNPTISESAQADEPSLTEFGGVKILLVENIDVNREIATMMLEQFGFTIDSGLNVPIIVMTANALPEEIQADAIRNCCRNCSRGRAVGRNIIGRGGLCGFFAFVALFFRKFNAPFYFFFFFL